MLPWITLGVCARTYTPKTRGEFFRILDNEDLVVVNFVDYDRSKDKPALIEDMQEFFLDLADDPRYAPTVAFVGVNVRDIPSLRESIKSLAELMKDEQTIIMLFAYGKPVKKEKQFLEESTMQQSADMSMKKVARPVVKKGLVSKRDLDRFIDKYFGDDIDQKLEDIQQQEYTRMQYVTRPTRYVRRVYYDQPRYYYPTYSGYYPRYYPGYYYPYYGYGSGVGFGLGVGPIGVGFGFGW